MTCFINEVERVNMPSLNHVKRKKELMKISNENQVILKRLQNQAPTYSVNKWENDFRRNLYLRQNLLQTPPIFEEQNRVTQYGSLEPTEIGQRLGSTPTLRVHNP